MSNFYYKNNINNILLVVNKKISFDENLKGDFNFEKNLLTRKQNKEYIFTGCQIFNKDLLSINNKKTFSINEIWNESIKRNSLYGFECKSKFFHVTDLKIYNRLLKSY